MNVFDFDNTIYNGESTIDFFLFCLKKQKELCIYIPLVIHTATLYKLRLLPIDKIYELANNMTSLIINNKENILLVIIITSYFHSLSHFLYCFCRFISCILRARRSLAACSSYSMYCRSFTKNSYIINLRFSRGPSSSTQY